MKNEPNLWEEGEERGARELMKAWEDGSRQRDTED